MTKLTTKETKTIEGLFTPVLAEQKPIIESYELLIKAELNTETFALAKVLDKQLLSIEQAIDSTHKAGKAKALAEGKYYDALKNQYKLPISQMREKTKAIKDYEKNQLKEKIEKLAKERLIEAKKYYENDYEIPQNLGEMHVDIWNSFVLGAKTNFDLREKAKKEEAEKQVLREKRAVLLNDFLSFIEDYEVVLSMSNDNFDAELAFLKDLKERQRIDLERLKVIDLRREKIDTVRSVVDDYDALIALSDEEFDKEIKTLKLLITHKEEQTRRVAILDPFVSYTENYNSILSATEEVFNYEIKHLESVRAREIAISTIPKEYTKNQGLEKLSEKDFNAKKQEIEQIIAKKKQEIADFESQKLEQEKRKQLDLAKGDKEKFQDLLKDLEAIKTKYSFESKEFKAKNKDAQTLIDKTIAHLTK